MLNSISSLAFKANSANKKRNEITRPADLKTGDIFSIKNTPEDKKGAKYLVLDTFSSSIDVVQLSPVKIHRLKDQSGLNQGEFLKVETYKFSKLLQDNGNKYFDFNTGHLDIEV
jgi:hypothetical protein